MNEGRSLKQRLEAGGLLVLPGVYDALTARIVAVAGFEAAYMSGYAVAASYGFPDIGLLTMTDMLDALKRICRAVNIPVIADADTGYGNAVNVFHTVCEYEKAGAAGIQLEDQTWPKRCGHMVGKHLIDESEMIDKIAAAVEARHREDLLLIARTDAIATHGFDEAVRRGRRYAEAGADVLFIEAPSEKHFSQIPGLFNKPCLINVAMPDPRITIKDLDEMGYAMAIFPGIALLGATEGAHELCDRLNPTTKHSQIND